jgi:hypothetical protein
LGILLIFLAGQSDVALLSEEGLKIVAWNDLLLVGGLIDPGLRLHIPTGLDMGDFVRASGQEWQGGERLFLIEVLGVRHFDVPVQ